MVKILVAILKGRTVPFLTCRISSIWFHSRIQVSSWGMFAWRFTHCWPSITCRSARHLVDPQRPAESKWILWEKHLTVTLLTAPPSNYLATSRLNLSSQLQRIFVRGASPDPRPNWVPDFKLLYHPAPFLCDLCLKYNRMVGWFLA